MILPLVFTSELVHQLLVQKQDIAFEHSHESFSNSVSESFWINDYHRLYHRQRNINDRVFKGHPKAKALNLIKINLWMETNTAFVRAVCIVMLASKACKYLCEPSSIIMGMVTSIYLSGY